MHRFHSPYLLAAVRRVTTSATLAQRGLDAYSPSTEADMILLTSAFEVICDVVVQATALTAFRLYRWADGQQYRR